MKNKMPAKTHLCGETVIAGALWLVTNQLHQHEQSNEVTKSTRALEPYLGTPPDSLGAMLNAPNDNQRIMQKCNK